MGRRGFTLIEIMLVVGIIALLAAIAMPNVLRGRMSATETAAIGNLRTLSSALEMFRSVNTEFPLTAAWGAALYGACPGGAGDPDPDFGPPSFCVPTLTNSVVQGYQYTYMGDACDATGCQAYTVTAVPQITSITGVRGLSVDSLGLMRHCVCPPGGVCAAPTAASALIDQPPGAC